MSKGKRAREAKSVLRGDYRISDDNELYQSKYSDILHEMVIAIPKKFKPGDRVRVTVERLVPAKRGGKAKER